MSFPNRYMSGLHRAASFGALTVSGSNTTNTVITRSGFTDALLQRYKMTQYLGLAEVWRPIGIDYTIGTSVTTPAAVLTLQKNGVNAATGGTCTIPVASNGSNVLWAAFSDYTFAAADAAADTWSLTVTTTAGAGVITATLVYATIPVLGISDGVSV